MEKFFATAALLFAAGMAFPQSAEKITEILNSQTISCQQAAYLARSAVNDSVSEEEAFNTLKGSNVIAQAHLPYDTVTFKEFANICASTWEVKGGLLLGILKNGRYALRQMKADGIIPKDTDPDKKVTGHEALNMVTNCIETYRLKGGAE